MNVAFIPVRGGSKSIPLKNIKLINGKPLVYWVIKAAAECNYIDKVYVSTDSNRIVECIDSMNDFVGYQKVEVIGRSIESATDTATTESAMLEFATTYHFKNIVLIQATSPLLSTDDLNRGFLAYLEPSVDSVLSVVRQKRFHWAYADTGFAFSTNYDVFNRPRRQDFEGYFVENGAFYITSRSNLLKTRNRVSGNIKLVEMPEETFFEIDEPKDWVIIESLLKQKFFNRHIPSKQIKMLLTDCDGCLTDGGMYYSENGDELKKFNTRDGMGFAILRQYNILSGIVTSENVKLNERRAKKLKVDILIQGSKRKLDDIKMLCKNYSIDLSNVCYIGDDINDIDALKAVGFSCCPANAVEAVKEVVDLITTANGGEGVIREVVNKIIIESAVFNKEATK